MKERIAQRLREARISRGYETAADCARAFGWNVVTYTSHENGTRGIKRDAAKRYARALGVPIAQLMGVSDIATTPTLVETVPIIAVAETGVWREKHMYGGREPSQYHERVSVPEGGNHGTFGVKVGDQSVDRVLPLGSVAICRPTTLDDMPNVAVGAIVVVQRKRGDLIEMTLRRVVKTSSTLVTISTHSTESRHHGSMSVPIKSGSSDIDVVGIVTAVYTPLES